MYGKALLHYILHALRDRACRYPRGCGIVYTDDTTVHMTIYELSSQYDFDLSRNMTLANATQNVHKPHNRITVQILLHAKIYPFPSRRAV
jgi:hypothetical protein